MKLLSYAIKLYMNELNFNRIDEECMRNENSGKIK